MKQTIKEYIKKHSNLNKTQIARLLYNDYPHKFDSVEHARSFVRRYCKNHQPSKTNYNKVHYIPKNSQKLLILNDLHIPYHKWDVIEQSLQYGKKRGFDSILFNGDCLDCYSISSFHKDPSMKNMTQELEIAHDLLAKIKKDYKVNIYYKEGNHENRILKHFHKNTPEFAGHRALSIPNLLGLKDLGISYIDNKKTILFGGLSILHGHELTCTSGGVNLARNVLHKSYTDVYVAHFHKYDYSYVKTLHGNMIHAYAGGCLCDLNPEFMPNNHWNHTISYVEKSNNSYKLDHFTI